MNYNIKRIDYDDIENYIRINCKSWKESYSGIVDNEFLDLINEEDEIKKSILRQQNKFYDQEEQEYHKFILSLENKPVGMFSVGKSRVDKYSNIGELCSIYLLNEAQNKGLGKIMFEYAMNELKTMGYSEVVIGCLKGNKTNEFYKHMGAEFKFERDWQSPNGQLLKENVYILKIS